MQPFYSAERVTLYLGDCLEVMRTLPDASVDAVVTDPPYELGFMGKGWDASGIAYCVPMWREVLRVLKPGGHLAAFGGTRTYHRMASAIEDAGFEIRDTLAYMYGSGFPKSLDVSKAIDKKRDDSAAIKAVTAFVALARDRSPLTNRDIDAHFGFNGMAGHWTTQAPQHSVPTWEQWCSLKGLLALSDQMDAEVWRLNGRKGTPGEAWGEREVVGQKDSGLDTGGGQTVAFLGSRGRNEAGLIDVTAPATDAARQWEGWGTALKPAWESIVLATKPGDCATIDASLSRLESDLWSMLSASGVALPSPSSPGVSDAGQFDGARWSADGSINTPDVSSEAMATLPSALALTTCWNTVRSWRRILGALSSVMSTFTTEITSSLTTDLKTLSSSVASITAMNMLAYATTAHGSTHPVALAVECFHDAARKLNAIRTLFAPASATSPGRTSPPAEAALSPLFEPIVLARKPLIGTVAANVLAHGTGALNIDGTRIAHETINGGNLADNPHLRGTKLRAAPGVSPFGREGEETPLTSQSGRWPANVLLDEEAAALLDATVGDLTITGHRTEASRDRWSAESPIVGQGGTNAKGIEYPGDRGGPSRFFYTAKASRSEREAGVEVEPARRADSDSRDEDAAGSNNPRLRVNARRNDHPTVKPVDLMAWLCRLVTPPGGVILDPFLGSGTTALAALDEGFECIGIEREERYIEIARHRVTYRHLLEPVAVTATSEQPQGRLL